jgi:hypothetical protein
VKTTREATAAGDGKRMTLVELRWFVAALDGQPGDTPVRAVATVGGWLRSVKVEVEEDRE